MAEIEMKPLPKSIENKIEDLWTESRIADDKGDIAHAITLDLKAWNLIPDPKEPWIFYSQIVARGIAKSYLDIGDAEKFRKWMAIVYQMYHDPKAETYNTLDSLMEEGIGLYKLEHFDEALAIFRKAWRLYGRKAFPLEYVEYYKFMMENRGRL